MERIPQRGEFWLWQVPVLGALGKKALSGFGARESFENVTGNMIREDETVERVLEALTPSIDEANMPFHAQELARVKARIINRQTELDGAEFQGRLADLRGLMEQYPDFCGLEALGLEFDREETLRIMLKEDHSQ